MTKTQDITKVLKLLSAKQKAEYELAKFMWAIQAKYDKKTREFLVVGCGIHGRTASKCLCMADAYDKIKDEVLWTAFGWPYIQQYIGLTTVAKRKKLRAAVKKGCNANGVLKSPRVWFIEQKLVKKKLTPQKKADEFVTLANEIAHLIKNGYGFIMPQLSKPSQKLINKIKRKRKAS